MAKNKDNKEQKKAPVVAAQAMTTENVMDQVRKGNLMDQSLTKKVLEDIEKEKDEEKARTLKRIILKASYHRILALIQLRARRRESELTLEKLKRAEILEDQVAGFMLSEDKIKKHGGKDAKLTVKVNGTDTDFELKEGEDIWVPATITPAEYHEKERELNADIRKKLTESNEQLSKETKELRDQYPGYYSYDWDW